MSEVTWDRLTRACADVAALPPVERAAALARLERESPALAAEVRSLLAADRPLSIDGGEAAAALRDDSHDAGTTAAPPVDRIGRYRIEARIGRGASATVYRARTEVPPRPVAIKLFDAIGGEEDRERTALRRFDAEVRALSRLRHPGIATILDAGTTRIDGRERRWIAMDLVEGPPITEWARVARPGPGVIVRLAADLAAAVAHAHGRGIIHRDLKPANVLVEVRDGEPVVRVLDFGVARLLEDEEEVTRVTRGGQVIGTVGYLAPEQVTGDPEAVSVAVDVYAMGLILHELLGGRPAIDLPTGPLVARLQAVARARPQPVRTVVRGIDEDLAVIVDTATARAAGDRYASAAVLEQDLRRRLAGRPIAARPLSTFAQACRFVGRHRAATATAAVAAVVLPVLLAITATSLAAERRSTERLARSLVASLDVANAMADAMDRRFGATAFLEEYYRRQFEHVSGLIPAVAAGAVIEDPVIVDVVDRHEVEGWRVVDDGGRRVARYRDVGGGHTGPLVRDSELRETWGDALLRFSSVLTRAADLDAALAARVLGLAIEREALARDPQDPERRREHALATIYLGDTMHHLGDVDTALELYQRALVVDRALAEERPHVRRHRDDVAWGLDRIANIERHRDPARARALHRERMALCDELLAEMTPADGRAWGHALHGRAVSAWAMVMLARDRGDESLVPWLHRAQRDAVRLHRAFPADEAWASLAGRTTFELLERMLAAGPEAGVTAETMATLGATLREVCETRRRAAPDEPAFSHDLGRAWMLAARVAVRAGRWGEIGPAMEHAAACFAHDGGSAGPVEVLAGWTEVARTLIAREDASPDPALAPGGPPAAPGAAAVRDGLRAAIARVEDALATGRLRRGARTTEVLDAAAPLLEALAHRRAADGTEPRHGVRSGA